MNGTVEQFKESLNAQPTRKSGQNGHYCAPRVKDPLLARILKLGGKEIPATDKEFWAMAPKVNEFILLLIDSKVTELEQEVARQEAAEKKVGAKH